ncbi:MAG: hypothetical protein ACTSWN_08080 [Promethearchaeota archaeon]
MEKKLNIKLLNIYLIVAFITLAVMVVIIDLPEFLKNNDLLEFRFWYLSVIHPNKIIASVFATIAGIMFFLIAIWYNPVRKKKTSQYLSSLIFNAIIYQGISRFFELYYMLSESSLAGIVYVCGKYYFALDVLGSVLLVIVAFSIFMLPAMTDSMETKVSKFLTTLSVLASLISIATLFFFYLPITIFTYIIIAIALGMFFIVVITVLATSVKVFKLLPKVDNPVSRKALPALGIQLILAVVVILLMILAELGSSIGIGHMTTYVIRYIKNAIYLIIAVLFIPSLITPSRRLIEKK